MAWTNTERALLAILVASLLVAGGAVAQSYLLTAGHGGTFDNPDGPAVTLGADYGISGDNPFGTDGSVTIQDTTIDGPAGSSVTLTDPSSANPTISSIDANGGTIEANTNGIQTVGISGSITSLTYRNVDLQDDQTTELDASGTGTVYVHGFSADQWIRVDRANGNDELVQADSSGVVSVSVSNGAQLTLVETGGGPTLSSPAPTGGQQFSTTDVDLSVDVTDPDFDTANEQVELEWYVDGQLDGTTTVSSSGTATYTTTVPEGGEHEWYVVATDIEGSTSQSGSSSSPHTFQTPGTLHIRDEESPSQLVDANSVEIRFYFEDDPDPLIVNRTASDGTVDMAGLPTNRPFVVVAETENYYPRRIYKESLIESDNIYLLNDSTEAVEPTFDLVDYSGSYPEEDTVMLIQRALENPDTGTIDWRTVQGDFFGATGQFPAQLRYNERHRLVLINTETGDRLVKGQYTPTTSELHEVTVTSDEQIELRGVDTLVSIAPSTRSLVAQNDTVVTAIIDSRSTSVESWNVTVTYSDNKTSRTLYQNTGSGSDEVAPALNLSGLGGGRVTVSVDYELSDGTTGSRSATFSVSETYDNQYSLFSVLASAGTLLPGQHADQAFGFLAIVFTVIGTAAVGATLRPSTEAVGLIAVAFVGVFYTVGWLGSDVLFIAFVGWIAIAGVRRGI